MLPESLKVEASKLQLQAFVRFKGDRLLAEPPHEAAQAPIRSTIENGREEVLQKVAREKGRVT